jgi:hypothetical protein
MVGNLKCIQLWPLQGTSVWGQIYNFLVFRNLKKILPRKKNLGSKENEGHVD